MYPNLLNPLILPHITIPNRTVMGSMHTNLEEIPGGFERAAVYYAERAKGKAGLIITGGISPNTEGCVSARSAMLTHSEEVKEHALITEAVHKEGGLICMQILHTGRYGYHPNIVAPSAVQAPINVFTPKEMDEKTILKTIDDFGSCALLAREAGYDGVEIMGSEGYLINQFIATRTNKRTDLWGGSYQNRIRFALSIVENVRQNCGEQFLIIFRLSLLDLVDEGSTWPEVVLLAKELEKAGVDIINTGIGWHEARIPTIATSVPRRAFSSFTGRLKQELTIPVIAANRINSPEIAESILAEQQADLVSMARPFLADPDFVLKAMKNKANEINTCIACNQACLDHTFQLKISSCMVNPRACHETELQYTPTTQPKNVAVVGGGPAGMAFAHIAAMRGHHVTLYEASQQLGGQFNLAKVIPGKEEYAESIRFFSAMQEKYNVKVILNTKATPEELNMKAFEEIVLACGVHPRKPDIAGIDSPHVHTYEKVLSGNVVPGNKVAIIGSGGIGFDVAAYLSDDDVASDFTHFAQFWGIDSEVTHRGGLTTRQLPPPKREIYLLQRKGGKPGASLGKTTGWIHKSALQAKGVQMWTGVQYNRIDDNGLHLVFRNEEVCLPVTDIVICAGQDPNRDLYDALVIAGHQPHCIGGSDKAEGLDAKLAIDQACRLAASL